MGKSKAIIPKRLVSDPRKMAQVMTNTMNGVAQSMKVDFEVTVQTWDDPASFTIEAPSIWVRIIATEHDIYSMLNKGTKAHDIFPKNKKSLAFTGPFRSKTVPNQIMSRSGSKGSNQTILPRGRGVKHPGTKARNWDKTIAKKWRRLAGNIMQRAIDSAV